MDDEGYDHPLPLPEEADEEVLTELQISTPSPSAKRARGEPPLILVHSGTNRATLHVWLADGFDKITIVAIEELLVQFTAIMMKSGTIGAVERAMSESTLTSFAEAKSYTLKALGH